VLPRMRSGYSVRTSDVHVNNVKPLYNYQVTFVIVSLGSTPRLVGEGFTVWSDANMSFPSQKICCLRVVDEQVARLFEVKHLHVI
jgi:hypothetical protein